MDEDFSLVIFVYGMAIVLAVGKAFTLWIWSALPKPRPPLRQEVLEAWQRRKARLRAEKAAVNQPRRPPSADETPGDTSAVEGGPTPASPASSTNEKNAL
jgi:hypothetical protein